MGANLSCATLCDTNGEGPSSKPRLGDIPESCLALVLMHLDPPDICKLARLNRAFHGASSADFIWESKLPSNYKFICEKVLDEKTVVGLEKKDVYARMCRPNPFDGGTKVCLFLSLNSRVCFVKNKIGWFGLLQEVWLDKNTGGACFSISSKGLSITGIDDRRYWNHISTEESR